MNNNNNNDAVLRVNSIQEMKDSETSGLTYSLVASVKEVFRTKEGLNIFTITDGEQDFKLIKFVPGSAAYPELNKNSIAVFIFKRHLHDGSLQGKLSDVKFISDDKQIDFKNDLFERQLSKFKPVTSELLFNTPSFNAMKPKLKQVATLIRKAVIEHRPIVISHHNDTDGFTAGLLLEDAIKPLIEKHFPMVRFMANFLTRYPSRTPFYDLVDATKDISLFLQNMDRAETSPPLILIVDNGSTAQDILSINKVKLFGADVAVIDHHDPGVLDSNGQSLVCKETLAHLNPHLVGVKENLSASLICYELSRFINESVKPNKHTALLGAIADRCDGLEVEQLLSELKTYRDEYKHLASISDYEIYQTKMFLPTSALMNFLRGEKVVELSNLYKPIIEAEREQIKSSVLHYKKTLSVGKYKLNLLDGELTTLRGEYYQIGRLAGVLSDSSDDLNVITCVYSNSFVVFRAKQEQPLFDVNKLIPFLQKKLPHARLSGGGHAVAGSIKLLPIAMDDTLKLISEFISNL